MNEGEGKFRREITSEVTNQFFVTEQKATQLSGELDKQTKSVGDNSELLLHLMSGIGSFGDDMKKIIEEMNCWRNPEVLETEDDLNCLHDPVLLTIPVSKGPEVINLLSSDDSAPPPIYGLYMFPMGGLEGILVASMAQDAQV